MKVALVYPEYYDIAHFGVKRREIPPFGVMYLAAVVEQKGVEVELFRAGLDNHAFDFSPYDIVGFSTSSSVTYPLIRKVRDHSIFRSSSLLIAGGIHATLFPREVLSQMRLNLVCLGESELTMSDIIDHFPSGAYEDIPGIAYADNAAFRTSSPRPVIWNLDGIPFPARHLVPTADIVMNDRLAHLDVNIAHVMCSRGCPFNCHFCAAQDRTMRYRTGSDIADELQSLVTTYGIKGFCITDDNFVVHKQNVQNILKAVMPLGLMWSTLSRVDTIDDELLNLMKASGCVEIKYGIESGSPRVLELMNKRITTQQIENTIRATHQRGIGVKAFIIHGFPGENVSSTAETIALLDRLKDQIQRISLFRFVPLPGSYVYSHPEKFALTLPSDFSQLYIYNNETKWWGTETDRSQVEQSYRMLESFVQQNWETY